MLGLIGKFNEIGVVEGGQGAGGRAVEVLRTAIRGAEGIVTRNLCDLKTILITLSFHQQLFLKKVFSARCSFGHFEQTSG